MNRLPRALLEIEALVRSTSSRPPVEALVVERLGLIRILRRVCADLHEERQRVSGPLEVNIVQQIEYWDDVLAWVKQQGGGDLIVMNRKV